LSKKILVTGGAGFIGTNFVYYMAGKGYGQVVLDKLTYAGGKDNLDPLINSGKIIFIHGDICDKDVVKESLITSSILLPKAITQGVKPIRISSTALMLKAPARCLRLLFNRE
jgi:dTDP-D-glucose 4,6-dehydratase